MTAFLSTREIGFTVTRAFAEHHGRTVIRLHEIEPGAARTSCYTAAIGPYADERDRVVNPANLAGHIRWCDRDLCWSRHRRCVVCGAPAGYESECGPCTRAAIEADKQIERAAA